MGGYCKSPLGTKIGILGEDMNEYWLWKLGQGGNLFCLRFTFVDVNTGEHLNPDTFWVAHKKNIHSRSERNTCILSTHKCAAYMWFLTPEFHVPFMKLPCASHLDMEIIQIGARRVEGGTWSPEAICISLSNLMQGMSITHF